MDARGRTGGRFTVGAIVGAALAVAFLPVGATAAPVSQPLPPDWHLAFASDRDGDDDIYAVDGRGGRVAVLTRNDRDDGVAYSTADGGFVAIRGFDDVVLVSADGLHERAIGDGVAVAPDGRTMAVSRPLDPDRSAMQLLVPGRAPRRLGHGWPGEFSPNARYLSYVTDSFDVAVIDLHTGRRHIVIPESRRHAGNYLGWSPSGRFIAWTSDGGTDEQPAHLWIVDALKPEARIHEIYAARTNLDATWIAGDRIGLNTRDDDRASYRMLDVRGHRLSPVVRTRDECDWSPLGTALACTSPARSRVISLTGGPTQVVSTELLVWSHDGRLLAGRFSGAAGVLDVRTWRITRLAPTKKTSYFRWSPDDRALAWDDGARLVVATLGAGRPHPVRFDGVPQLAGAVWLRGRLPARARSALPLPPSQIAAGFELRTSAPIVEIASDGARVAAVVASTRSDCTHAVAWKPGTAAIHFGPRSVCSDGAPILAKLRLAETTLTWSSYGRGNSIYESHDWADVGRPGLVHHGEYHAIWDPENDPPDPEPDLGPFPTATETRGGVTFSLAGGSITLTRVDGTSRTLRPPGGAVDGELEDTGLFYAYTIGHSGYPGRLVFMPFASLFR